MCLLFLFRSLQPSGLDEEFPSPHPQFLLLSFIDTFLVVLIHPATCNLFRFSNWPNWTFFLDHTVTPSWPQRTKSPTPTLCLRSVAASLRGHCSENHLELSPSSFWECVTLHLLVTWWRHYFCFSVLVHSNDTQTINLWKYKLHETLEYKLPQLSGGRGDIDDLLLCGCAKGKSPPTFLGHPERTTSVTETFRETKHVTFTT